MEKHGRSWDEPRRATVKRDVDAEENIQHSRDLRVRCLCSYLPRPHSVEADYSKADNFLSLQLWKKFGHETSEPLTWDDVIVQEQKPIAFGLSATYVPGLADTKFPRIPDNSRFIDHDRLFRMIVNHYYLAVQSLDVFDQALHLFGPISCWDDNCQIQTKFTRNHPRPMRRSMNNEDSNRGSFLYARARSPTLTIGTPKA